MSYHPVNTTDLHPKKPADRKTFIYLILIALFAVSFNLGGRPIEAKDYVLPDQIIPLNEKGIRPLSC
jgi:hypothetical protein